MENGNEGRRLGLLALNARHGLEGKANFGETSASTEFWPLIFHWSQWFSLPVHGHKQAAYSDSLEGYQRSDSTHRSSSGAGPNNGSSQHTDNPSKQYFTQFLKDQFMQIQKPSAASETLPRPVDPSQALQSFSVSSFQQLKVGGNNHVPRILKQNVSTFARSALPLVQGPEGG